MAGKVVITTKVAGPRTPTGSVMGNNAGVRTPIPDHAVTNNQSTSFRPGTTAIQQSQLGVKLELAPQQLETRKAGVRTTIEHAANSRQPWAIDLRAYMSHVPAQADRIVEDLALNPYKLAYLQATPVSIRGYFYDLDMKALDQNGNALEIGRLAYELRHALTEGYTDLTANAIFNVLSSPLMQKQNIAFHVILNHGSTALEPLIDILLASEENKPFHSFAREAIDRTIEKDTVGSTAELVKISGKFKGKASEEAFVSLLVSLGSFGYEAALKGYKADLLSDASSSVFVKALDKLIRKVNKESVAAQTMRTVADIAVAGKLSRMDKALLNDIHNIIFDNIESVLQNSGMAELRYLFFPKNLSPQNASLLFRGIEILLGAEGSAPAHKYLEALRSKDADVRYFVGLAYIGVDFNKAVYEFKKAIGTEYQKELERFLSVVGKTTDKDLYLALEKAFMQKGNIEMSAEMHIQYYFTARDRADVSRTFIRALKYASSLWQFIEKTIRDGKPGTAEVIKDILEKVIAAASEMNKRHPYELRTLEEAASRTEKLIVNAG